jgi:predicted Zn-dependent peptidase
MPQARTAAFSLVVRVGSRHEDEASHGASHLLEHMFFRGTPRFPSAHALNAAVERIGSTLDASTSRDRTNFEMRTFPETLPEALALTGEILTEASFADLELERRVVLQERLDEVDASGRDVDLDNIAKAALWPIGGLGRKIIGTKRSIQGLDVPALRAHRDRYYVGRNMVLGVAGPLEPEAVWEAAERAFHGLPPGERSVIEPAGARTDLPACELVSHSGSQTDFELCFLGPPDGHPDTLALSMLLRVLDDGTASRLRVRLCDELGLAYDVGARLEVFEDTGLVGVDGAVAHAQIAEVLEETCRLLGKLQREPVSEEELNRARARVRLDLLSTLDSVESCATYLASAAANRNPEPLRDRMRRALAFDADDLRAVARRHFRPSAAQIALVGDVPRKLKRRIVSALDALDPDPG